MAQAAAAQDTADNKRRVFTSTPTTPYDVGDLWAQGESGDLMRCKKARATGDYTASDWGKASKYTDDTELTNFINGSYKDFKEDIQSQVDGKAETWYQKSDPSKNWSDDDKLTHKGDIWHNTSTTTVSGVEPGRDAIWNGAAWEMSDVPQSVYDTIDGKADIFVSKPTKYNVNDLWIIESTLADADMPSGCKRGDIVIASTSQTNTYNKADWSKKDRYTDDTALNSFVDVTYLADKENLQNQIDGKYETWFYEGVPTLENQPASAWNTASKKKAHVGDLYWDKTNKHAYRFISTKEGSTTTYSWTQIGDEGVIAAMAQAAAAQDTADNKRRVFTSTPVTPYDKGDLWAQGASGDLMRCKKARATGDYTASDWEKASKYTDDTGLTNFLSNTYASDITNIREQIDSKAETWYQATDPAGAWTDNTKKAAHVGDLWCDTSSTGGNKTYIYCDNGSGTSPRYAWKEQQVPDDVFDKIDGKADIFVTKPSAYNKFDMWIIEAGATNLPTGCVAGDIVIASEMPSGVTKRTAYTKSDWKKKDRYTDDTALETFKTNQYVAHLLAGSYDTDISNAASAYARDAAVKALLGALKAETQIVGGLVLTSLIELRQLKSGYDPSNPDSYTTWAGISGQYNSSVKGGGIAAWYGGGMVDHEASPSLTSYAKTIFRMDGSGYVAGGNITWDDNGKVEIQGNTLKTANFYLGGADVTQILGDLLDMFEFDKTSVQGTTFIKAKYSLYSVGDLSARGASGGGGGGGGGGASSLGELNDVTLSASVLNAQVLSYDAASNHWINKTLVLTAATSSALGGIKVGYTTNGKNYKVQLDSSNNAYVNVPWENTTYTLAGLMGSSAKGSTTQPIYWTGSAFANTSHTIGKSVPSDAKFTDTTYYAGTGISLSGTTFSNSGVREATINGNYLRVDTNGEIKNLTIPYASSAGNADTVDNEHASAFAHVGEHNNLTASGNEFTFASSGLSGRVWVNYRTAGGTNGDITEYNFGDGKGGALATISSGAFSGNAASATKLQTARTIWGQSFDGSGNVSGNMTGVGTISASGDIGVTKSSGATSVFVSNNNGKIGLHTDTNRGLYDFTSSKWLIATDGTNTWLPHGTVSIDSSAQTTYKLYVNGAVGVSGSVEATGSLKCNYTIFRNYNNNDWAGYVGRGSTAHNDICVIGYAGNGVRLGANNSTGDLFISASNNVGIGTGSPTQKLHVGGNIYATGDVTAASDGRQKEIVEDAMLTAEQIADAPAVKFTWKDKRDDDVHAGSIAQYWQKVLPEVVVGNDDALGLNYGAAAMVSSINLAREVVELKNTVKEQQKMMEEQMKMMMEQSRMIAELKAEVERLKKGGRA
jgi:hypothetical protein